MFPIILISWWNCHSAINPWTTLVKVSEICPITFSLWLVFFNWIETTCWLCLCYGSIKRWSSSTMIYYYYNNDDFNPSFDFYNSETERTCFVMHEDILVFDFQRVFEETFSNHGTVSFHIAETIASFTKFIDFCEIICASDECFCLRILTEKKHIQRKLQRLQSVQIGQLSHWYIKSNDHKRFFTWNRIFKKVK